MEGGAGEGTVSDSNASFPVKHSVSAISALLSGAMSASWVSRSPYSLLEGDGPIERVLPAHFQLNLDSCPHLGNPCKISHNIGIYIVPDG